MFRTRFTCRPTLRRLGITNGCRPICNSCRCVMLLNQTEAFSSGEYLLTLARGGSVPQSDSDRVANQLSRFTGLDAAYLRQENLREPIDRFINDLLKDQNRSVGRYDSRFTGIRIHPGTDDEDFDPSDEAVNGPFTAAFNDYVRRELTVCHRPALRDHCGGETVESCREQIPGCGDQSQRSNEPEPVFEDMGLLRLLRSGDALLCGPECRERYESGSGGSR